MEATATKQAAFVARDDGAYLITGGLGGIGLATGRWLAQRGARRLLLVGRSAMPARPQWAGLPEGSPLAERATGVLAMEQAGASVDIIPCDMGDAATLRAILAQYESTVAPIVGVFHAAGVALDALVERLEPAMLRDVFAPKVCGAWTLHRYFGATHAPLDCFVLFSSAAAMIGSPGQTNYAAANAMLDALAHARRAQGLSVSAINWGPWAAIGMAAASPEFTLRLAQRGIRAISPEEGIRALESVLLSGKSNVGVVDIDWDAMRRVAGADLRPLFAEIYAEKDGAPPRMAEGPRRAQLPAAAFLPSARLSAAGNRILAARGDERVALLTTYIQEQAATVLHVDQAQISPEAKFNDLGMDSIMLMELINAIERDTRLKLYPNEVIDRPCAADLAVYIAGELHAPEEATVAAPDEQGGAGTTPGRLRVTQRRDVFRLPKPAERNPSMVFVLSGPRVGSTLCRVMLAGHPRLFVPPELHLLPFYSMGEREAQLEGSYLAEGLQRAYMELMGTGPEAARAHIDALVARNATVQEVYAELQALCAPRLLVDKSPSYASSLDILERAEDLFDGALYIHLTRHPYSVIESFLRNRFDKFVYGGNNDPLSLAEEVWATTNSNVIDFFSEIEPSRGFQMDYEAMVGSPEKTMRACCKFLGLPYDPAVINPYDGARMTDGIHEKSFSIGDPNFLTRKKIEPELAAAWRKVRLGRRLGSFATRIAREMDYDLPHEGAARNGGQRPQQVVPIKPGGTRPPLFCVAPGGGIVFPYFNLRALLHPEQPLYGLQDPSLDPATDFAPTIAALAAEHVAAMRAVQPEGPYYLCGWSFGGAVAFEMAQALHRDGQVVALLAIIDAEAALPAPRESWTIARRVARVLTQIKTIAKVARHTGPYIRDGVYLVLNAARGRRAGGKTSIGEYFQWAWTDALRHHLLDKAHIAGAVKQDSRLMLVNQPSTRRVLQVLRANIRCLRAYRPEAYPGALTLFRAADQSTLRKHVQDPSLGWGRLALGGVEVIEVPGNHVVLLLEPYIHDLARALNEAIASHARAHGAAWAIAAAEQETKVAPETQEDARISDPCAAGR